MFQVSNLRVLAHELRGLVGKVHAQVVKRLRPDKHRLIMSEHSERGSHVECIGCDALQVIEFCANIPRQLKPLK